MTHAIGIERANEVATNLLKWADVLEIPSGDFVNEDLRRAAATITTLERQLATAREALEKLTNEVCGLKLFEGELRAELGNTNWNVLMLRADEARSALTPGVSDAE